MFGPHLSSQDQRDKRKLGSAKGFLHSGFGLQWPESQRRYAKAGKGLVIIPIESNNSNFGPLPSFSLRHPAVKSFWQNLDMFKQCNAIIFSFYGTTVTC